MPFLGKERLLYCDELVDAELEEERLLRREEDEDEGGGELFFDCLEFGGRGGGVGMDGTAVPGALTLSLNAGRWGLFGVVFGELWENYILRYQITSNHFQFQIS